MPRTRPLLPALTALACATSLGLGLTVAAAGTAVAAPAGSPAAVPSAAPAAAAGAVVRGAILQRYTALGGAQSYLGLPLGNEAPTPRRFGAYQFFQGGAIYWSPTTGAWDVHGLILADWAGLGYENSALGFPTGAEVPLPGGAVYESFEFGLYYFSPATGAHEVHGAILDEYTALGRETSLLGFPLSDELTTPDGLGRYEVFEHGSVYWTPITGAHEVDGAILDKWAAIGYEQSALSYPTSDPVPLPGGGRQSEFLLGTIASTPGKGALVTGFLAPVSSVNRVRAVFTVQSVQQSFRFDDNDTFLRLPLTSGTISTPAPPITITKQQFTHALGVDTFVLTKGYSLDPKVPVTYEIIDISRLPTTIAGRAALLRALP